MDIQDATMQELFDALLARMASIRGYEMDRYRYLYLTMQPEGEWTTFRAAIKPPPEVDDGDGLDAGNLWEPSIVERNAAK